MKITTEQLFEDARTWSGFTPHAVPDEVLYEIHELMKWGPTASNLSPARIVFVKSPEAKERLLGCVSAGNLEKTRDAAVTAIVGMDMAFYEMSSRLNPAIDAKGWFADKPRLIEETALRNSSLQGAYLIMAARALGLHCGPMSGFDSAKVDAAFWSGTTIRTNFLCNLGHGDPARLRPRGPRLDFDEACRIE